MGRIYLLILAREFPREPLCGTADLFQRVGGIQYPALRRTVEYLDRGLTGLRTVKLITESLFIYIYQWRLYDKSHATKVRHFWSNGKETQRRCLNCKFLRKEFFQRSIYFQDKYIFNIDNFVESILSNY